jgi:parallel beta helix pectate lyase-like protein
MTRLAMVLAVAASCGGLAAAALAHSSEAAPAAQIQRTFVSTSGNDANPCTRTDPCRGFAAAIANTLEGGEVIALDSGGFGPFTIDRSVTVAGAPGVHAAITAFSGTGVEIAAGLFDEVALRNLNVTGIGADTGVLFTTGSVLRVENVTVTGFAQFGLATAPAANSLYVAHSSFRRNGVGVSANALLVAEIDETRADDNVTAGYQFIGSLGTVRRAAATSNPVGFDVTNGSTIVITDSVADRNSSGVHVLGAEVDLTGITLAHNSTVGLITADAGALARIGGSTVTGNEIGIRRLNGTLETYGDNFVRGNFTFNTAGTITAVGTT